MNTNHKKMLTVSLALSVLGAWGSTRCLISGFGLHGDSLVIPATAFLTALVAGLLIHKRWGGTALLCLLAGLLGYLSRQPEVRNQCLSLIFRICDAYDSAYGWGMPAFPAFQQTAAADIPLSIYSSLTALALTSMVCTRKSSWTATFLVALPLGLCLVVTDTVPDVPGLSITLAILGLILMTDNSRQESTAQAGQLLRYALVPCVILLMSLLLLFPEKDYVNHTALLRAKLLTAAEEAADCFSQVTLPFDPAIRQVEQVPLSQLPQLDSPDLPVAQVTADQSGTLYLRSKDYDVYTGKDWESTEGRKETFAGQGAPVANVTVATNSLLDTLLLPYYPEPGTQLRDGCVKNDAQLREYRFSVYSAGHAAPPPESATALPDGCKAALASIGAQLTGGSAEPAIAAVLVGNYVSSRASYDKHAQPMPETEEDFALWFLNQGETGYCVHFATAAAVMMRALDIPARYVTGYKVEAVAGQTVTVTTGDAHAWAEYYDRTAGCWYLLEATPGAEFTAPTVLETIPPPESLPDTTQPEETEITQISHPSFPFPVFLPVLAGLIAVVPLRRKFVLTLRRRKQAAGSPNRRALAALEEAQLLASLRRQPVPDSLRELALKAKFSQHMLTEEELQQFADYRAEAIADLRTEPKWKRFADQYLSCGY